MGTGSRSVLVGGCVLALAGTTAPLVPAYAASTGAERSACPGVRAVVVTPQGEVATHCATAAPGRTAAEVFEQAGHRLTRVQRFPAAVCRVDGQPSDQACTAMPPADAYWGLFVSGTDGWTYAALGVDAVVPEAGDAVALAWQDTAAPVPPDAPVSGAGNTTGDTTRDATADAPDQTPDAALPVWVPVIVVAGLLGLAGLVARRRRSR